MIDTEELRERLTVRREKWQMKLDEARRLEEQARYSVHTAIEHLTEIDYCLEQLAGEPEPVEPPRKTCAEAIKALGLAVTRNTDPSAVMPTLHAAGYGPFNARTVRSAISIITPPIVGGNPEPQ